MHIDKRFLKNRHYIYCKECRKKNKKYDARDYCKKYDANVKREVFEHYSNGKIQCALCKCNDYRVLTIDHIAGGGNRQRKEQKFNGGAVFFRWLIKNDFPEGYRVLCRNCNWLEHLEKQKVTVELDLKQLDDVPHMEVLRRMYSGDLKSLGFSDKLRCIDFLNSKSKNK